MDIDGMDMMVQRGEPLQDLIKNFSTPTYVTPDDEDEWNDSGMWSES